MVLVDIHFPFLLSDRYRNYFSPPLSPVLSNYRLADDHAPMHTMCNAGTPNELPWANRMEPAITCPL